MMTTSLRVLLAVGALTACEASRAPDARRASAPPPSAAPPSAPPPGAPPRPDARTQQVMDAFGRTNAVAGCISEVHPDGGAAGSLRASLRVDAAGAARLTLTGDADPALARCIQERAARGSYGAGAPVAMDFEVVLGAR